MGDCPFWRKPCEKIKDCHFRRKGFRYFTDHRKPELFEECVFLVNCDLLENQVSRMIGQQGAIEGARNEIAKLSGFFKNLAEIKALENKDER